MASLFTGVSPRSHGVVVGRVTRANAVEEQPALPESFTTLAEAFQRAGFVTVGVPANLHLADTLGFGQGFDHYRGSADFMSADRVNQQVAEKLAEAFGAEWKTAWKEQPTFLWIHYFDPHDPYRPHEPWLTKYAPDFRNDRNTSPANLVMRELKRRFPDPDERLAARIRPLYESEISFLDDQLRQLDEVLDFRDDNVLFVLTADHGEEIVDHGRLGHAHSLYEELVHVPLLLHWPEGVEGGRRIESRASLLDLYPTLAELAHLRAPENLSGQSLVALLMGAEPGESRDLHFELDRPGVKAAALLSDEWKLVQQTFPEARFQLFDLVNDPAEQDDLSERKPEVVARLADLLARQLEALPPPPEVERVPIASEEILEQLRAFGYLGDELDEPDEED
jgi:arylsulfatase A-like enzyme